MSQMGRFISAGSIGAVSSLTGNVGGAVSPDGTGNINIIGTSPVTVTGNPGAWSLTITVNTATTTTEGIVELATDAESIAGADTTRPIVPSSLLAKLGTLTDHGLLVGAGPTNAITSIAVGTTGTVLHGVTGADPVWGGVDLTTDVTGILPVANGGTGIATITDHSVMVGSGVGPVTPIAVGTDGDVLIGVTGGDPIFNAITSTGGTIAITPGPGTLNIEAGGVNQSNIIYVGKHGNDANDGLTIERAKLTFGAAITAAGAIAPAAIVCLDYGTYTENLTGLANVDIFAPNATISGGGTLVSGNRWQFDTQLVANGATGFSFNSAGNICSVNVNKITCSGTGIGVTCLAGDMYIDVKEVIVATGSFMGASSTGKITIEVGSVTITGAGTAFGTSASADIDIIAGTVEDAGAGTLFYSTGAAAADISMTCSHINVAVLSDITAGTTVNLNVALMEGALAESGAGSVTTVSGATRIDNIPIGASVPNTGDFTVITATTPIGVPYGGSGAATFTDHGVLLGSGAGAFSVTAVGATNQVLLGSTGADPTWGTVPNAALTNSSITLSNGNNITITGSPVSLGGTATVNVSGTTQYAVQVGDATGSLDSLGVGATNTVLHGNTGANPSWSAVDLTADVTGILPVPNGGTGVNTLLDHGIMLGSGVGAVTSLGVGTTGVILTGVTGADPAWTTATYPATTVQGDVLYSSADNTIVGLAKNATATRYLANTGGANNPAWDQVDLSNGVTGTLPVGNGGSGATTFTDHGVLVGSGAGAFTALAVGTDGQVLLGSSAADPVFATLTSTGGTVTFTPGAGTLNLEAAGGGISWTEVTGTTQAAAINNGYIANNGALVTITLPSTAAVGSIVRVIGLGAGGWKIAQNASQYIRWDESNVTTTGVGGSLDSTDDHDAVELICTVTNNGWGVLSSKGNISLT